MSLHGRIYVEKSITLELQRKKQMDNHIKQLADIKESQQRLNMREVTKSTDLKMRNANMKRMYNNGFKEA